MENVHPLIEVLVYFALGLVVSLCGYSVIHHGYGQNQALKNNPDSFW